MLNLKLNYCVHTDINECLDENACAGNSTCNNTNGNYTCACDTGYELKSGADEAEGAKTEACLCEYAMRVFTLGLD